MYDLSWMSFTSSTLRGCALFSERTRVRRRPAFPDALLTRALRQSYGFFLLLHHRAKPSLGALANFKGVSLETSCFFACFA